MIQTGDKFTSHDLTQSVNELCDAGICKYLGKSGIGISVGDTLIMPNECTPDEYYTTCMNEYNAIPSSAISLDTQLREKGFKTTYRFSHQYRHPGLSAQQIIRDAYRLDYFRQIYTTATPRKQYTNEYYRMITDAFSVSYYYAQYLWAFNRGACGKIAGQLQMPNPTQWGQIIGAILGVGFQFHPDDIYEYSIEHINPNMAEKEFDARYATQLEYKNKMMSDYGIDTGCLVLSPKNREKLKKIATRTDTPYWIQVIQCLNPLHKR